MRTCRLLAIVATVSLCVGGAGSAHAAYWNLFNFEGESANPAIFATYDTLQDMLLDTNRTGTFTPSGNSFAVAANVIDSGSDGSTYWNLFNFEGESANPAIFATYATLQDMLLDTNRTGTFTPSGNSFAVAANVIGGNSDGSTYWNLFNFEGESANPAIFATYDTLQDMLLDINRTGTFTPSGNSFAVAANVIGSGSDGSAYWNLFNFEGESVNPAIFATYDTLQDMLLDINRTGTFTPSGNSFAVAANVIGGGSDNFPVATVPEPSAWATMILGLGAAGALLRRRRLPARAPACDGATTA